MRAIAVLGCLLFIAMPLSAQEQPQWLALVGGTVFDGTGGRLRATTTILVENEHIVQIGPARDIAVPEGAMVIDVRGKWIVPGLIDARVHFSSSGGLYASPDLVDLRAVKPYEDEVAEARKTLPETFARYIASGITGVIDMGGPLWTFDVRALASGIPRAPRVAVTGPIVAAEVPSALAALDDPPVLHVPSPAQVEGTVDHLLAYEPDLIKIWLAAGAIEDAPEWVSEVIESGRAAGVPVVAHAPAPDAARALARAGVNALADALDHAPIEDELLAILEENGIIYISTLVGDEGYREVLGREVRLLEIERLLGDQEAIESFRDIDTLPREIVPARDRDAPEYSNPVAAANLVRLQAGGITIAAGSDAGNIGILHGPALHRALELMVAAGLTPTQALLAATRGGAAAMGREDDLGTIEAGKLADLVILDADPTADIRNTQKIHRVIKGGIVFDPIEITEELNLSAEGDG